MMKAALYSAFNGPIEIKSLPQPTLTHPHSIILQVMATGVCRSDWHGWKGHDDDIAKFGLPFVPGHEVSGLVLQVGRDVQSISIGDRVAVPFILSCGSCAECHLSHPTTCLHQEQPGFTRWGSFASYCEIPRADRNLRKIPKGVTFVEAAALGCRFTTAFRAVVQQGLQLELGLNFRESEQRPSSTTSTSTCTNTSTSKTSSTQPKKSIVVFGCGGLGLSCIMIAKAFEREGKLQSIIAVDVSSLALQKAKSLGATHTLDITQYDSSEKVISQIHDWTHGMGCDVSIDAAGFPSTCENAVACTRRRGRMIQVGLPIGGRPPIVPMGMVAAKELELVGSHGFAATDLPDLLELVRSGRLNVRNLVEKEVSLEEGVQALMDMDSKSPLGITMITRFEDQSRL